MAYLTLEIGQWAVENFGECELGDIRRTRRVVTLAEQMAHNPSGSTLCQTEHWADAKAAYRLYSRDEATFEALARPHWERTRSLAAGRVLLLGDTMETDFGIHRDVEGLGPTGDGNGRGFLLHNSLMVDAATAEVVGLAGQELFYRQPAPEGENSYQASQRERESEVWGRVIDRVGPPATGVQYIHIFDRGADNLEVFCHLKQQNCDWVIRAAQLHRTVYDETEEKSSLQERLNRCPVLGTYTLKVPPAKQRKARTATLEVRTTKVTLKRPQRMTPSLRKIGFQELTQWVVEVREVNPPQDVEPLRWVLWTSLPIESFDDAWQVIEYYERRWLIEELHKAMKTGCRLEARQYLRAARLEAIAGMISVLAVRLLQLKCVARAEPDRAARQIVPKAWLEMLQALRKRSIKTVGEFFRHLAGLGGFLMRKHDGEPGWITLWRGVEKLLLGIRAYDAMTARSG